MPGSRMATPAADEAVLPSTVSADRVGTLRGRQS